MTDRNADMRHILAQVRTMTGGTVMEDEQSDQRTRDATEAAYEAIRDFLTRHADYLPDVLQSVRDGDFALRGSKAGLARDLIIVFTHAGHSGIGTAGSNDVILINCLRKPGDTTYLETRFGTGAHDSFVHEYAHYLSQGRAHHNSVADYEQRGESAYYNNPEEVHANYVEATAGFKRLMRGIIEHGGPEHLQEYQGMSDQQLYEFLRRSCVKSSFLKNLDPRSRRRFDKRCIRFVNQTIRPMLNTGKVAESLTEQRVTTWGGATINVLHNPTKKAFENAISGDVQVLRGLMSDDGTDLYLWDAYMAVHPNVMQELGLGDYDCISYNRGRWNGPVRSLQGGYKPAIERITPTPPPTDAERARDAKLLQDLFDDPDFAKLMGESQSYALAEDTDPTWKWWLNVDTGAMLPVKRAHVDMTSENPGQFGVTPQMIDRIKQEHPDLDPEEGHDLSWWEMIRYEAQKLGWVRIGSQQEMQEVARPYIYAASIKQAQAAIRIMQRKAIIIDAVEIEITNPDEPMEGYGEFIELEGEAQIKRFMFRRA